MEGKSSISDYRSKLDKTLASPDLKNDEKIHTLLKNQILQSSDYQFEEYSEYVVEKRSKEISNFLSMLRSASVDDVERSKSSNELHSSWKIKQDTDEFRVMYREGQEGTPFHTLLVEGYVDGPVDVCLCISCESDLYKKWWPQTAIPTFKVISSQCVKKVRIGEQISLVRMKVSWPLSSREALVHFFTFEYFQDGLIVVLLNTISDSETIDRSTHGFTRDGIPDAEDVVRIDVVGGFALQKVTADRSYFRTIANMDIKLDFVPPAFINFISRQLVGSGFKLYKKEVASVSKGDEKFREALEDPLYTRTHEALYSQNAPMASPALENLKSISFEIEEESKKDLEDGSPRENNEYDDGVIDLEAAEATDVDVRDRKACNEIEAVEEEESEGSESLNKTTQKSCDHSSNETAAEVMTEKTDEVEYALRTTDEITQHVGSESKNKVVISPEVRQALGTLEKAISIFRECSSNPGKEQISSEADQIKRKNGTCDELEHKLGNSSDNHGSSTKKTNETKTVADESSSSSSSHIKHIDLQSSANQTSISTSLTEMSPPHIKHVIDLQSSVNQTSIPTAFENTTATENYSLPRADANSGIDGKGATKRKNRKSTFCCLNFNSG